MAAVLKLRPCCGRYPRVGILAEVDVVFPHEILINTQSGEQVLIAGPLTRSTCTGSLICTLSLCLETVGTRIGLVTFDLAASTE